MGDHKRKPFEERKAEAEFRKSLDKQQMDAWQEEVDLFRKTFNFDVGIIDGAPLDQKLVVVRLPTLRARFLGITEAPKPETYPRPDNVVNGMPQEVVGVPTKPEGEAN